MPGTLQPLDQNLTIVGSDGKPTLYFIKWAQQRQIDIGDSITLAQAQALIDAWAAARDVLAGTGLSGGGNLSSDVTLSLNAGLNNLNDVDLTTPPSDGEALVYDSGTSQWIPGSVAGGLDVQEEGSSVVNPATALNFIGSSVTVTDGGGGVAEITVTGGGGSAFSGARAKKTTTQVIGSTATAVTWDAEDFDTDNYHDNSTNNSRITIPAGVSYVELTAAVASTAGSENDYSLWIVKNGSTTYPGIVAEGVRSLNGARKGLVISSGPIAVTAGDYFEVYMQNFSNETIIVAGSFFAVKSLGS